MDEIRITKCTECMYFERQGAKNYCTYTRIAVPLWELGRSGPELCYLDCPWFQKQESERKKKHSIAGLPGEKVALGAWFYDYSSHIDAYEIMQRCEGSYRLICTIDRRDISPFGSSSASLMEDICNAYNNKRKEMDDARSYCKVLADFKTKFGGR